MNFEVFYLLFTVFCFENGSERVTEETVLKSTVRFYNFIDHLPAFKT